MGRGIVWRSWPFLLAASIIISFYGLYSWPGFRAILQESLIKRKNDSASKENETDSYHLEEANLTARICPSDAIIKHAAEQRRLNMIRACRENALLIDTYDNYTNRGPGRRAYPSKRNKVVYFAIHKNGHTAAAEYIQNDWEIAGVAKRNPHFVVSVEGLNIPWKTNMLWSPWKDYLKFTFINEPLVRIVSGFLEKLYRPSTPIGFGVEKIFELTRPGIKSKSNLMKGANYWSEHKPRIEELFQYLDNENNTRAINPHWKPQFLFWPFCDPQMFDFVGTVGNIGCEIEYIARQASGLKSVSRFFHHDRNDLAQRGEFLRPVSPQLVRRVLLKHYLLDYKIFGYDIPDFDNWNSTIDRLFSVHR